MGATWAGLHATAAQLGSRGTEVIYVTIMKTLFGSKTLKTWEYPEQSFYSKLIAPSTPEWRMKSVVLRLVVFNTLYRWTRTTTQVVHQCISSLRHGRSASGGSARWRTAHVWSLATLHALLILSASSYPSSPMPRFLSSNTSYQPVFLVSDLPSAVSHVLRVFGLILSESLCLQPIICLRLHF